MVSLINFKVVSEELQSRRQERINGRQQVSGWSGEAASERTASASGDRRVAASGGDRIATEMTQGDGRGGSSVVQIGRPHPQGPTQRPPSATTSELPTEDQGEDAPADLKRSKFKFVTSVATAEANRSPDSQQTSGEMTAGGHELRPNGRVPNQITLLASPQKPAMFNLLSTYGADDGPGAGAPSGDTAMVCVAASGPAEFVVTWRSLRFAIEPKWHQNLSRLGPLAALASRLAPGSAQQANSGEQQVEADYTRVVLDRMDGSFKSGELTAILGPSGAGKTTLLDCLTGHRKHGLSGSIRISSPGATSATAPADLDGGKHLPYCSRAESAPASNAAAICSSAGAGNKRNLNFMTRAEAQQPAEPSTRNKLKVSIIPQNDHLIGHLTVYETLSYASKMKNCFERHFDHKLNIQRVAQQLGLMTCLATRINKLSGGQYKRVSIAQELLSSPDILILDEPTSGLDAMTCYQTVQVLRKLTDERQASGLKQIAVILTIHQPNSDVFQQFNHVYVVAQGGKCVYEGPPASIESVINRVGIRLPNSHYNPATMIVEIAAGKFGQDAIHKLNSIQKKQYDFVAPDEQNSTGDSAVDCPSSSSSNEDDDVGARDKVRDHNRRASNLSNGAKIMRRYADDSGGLVNKGFVIESELKLHDDNNNDTNNNNNVSGDVIVTLDSKGGLVDSPAKIKMMNSSNCAIANSSGETNICDGRRKKRRRVRKRVSESNRGVLVPVATGGPLKLVPSGHSDAGAGDGGENGGGGGGSDNPKREKRVKLNSLKADQKFPFWRHTYLHFHRSWLSIVRDPMLCSMQLALHIMVPLMVSLVYGTNVGKPNACPRAGPVDIMAYALEPTDFALQLQEDLRTTLENIGYIFFKLYGIIFAAMTVTVLTFPLDMHVLVKEFRNGWYGLSSYFLGRTLADIPFQLTLPLLAMSLSYYATGQPYSYMQWRFLSITGILILSSLIAQSQGLLFGAILMDKMKAAVFVAPAATTPIILFAGFLVRTQSIPRYLRPLSNLSYLRYAIEACLISRYGFNQCECDPAVFNQTVPELPPIAKSMLDYWLSSFKPPVNDSSHELGDNSTLSIETTTLAAAVESPDLFTKLIDSLARANSFGRNITSCEQVVPYPMIDYDLKDSQLFNCFAILIFMLVFTRLLTFFIVCFKVKRKV